MRKAKGKKSESLFSTWFQEAKNGFRIYGTTNNILQDIFQHDHHVAIINTLQGLQFVKLDVRPAITFQIQKHLH